MCLSEENGVNQSSVFLPRLLENTRRSHPFSARLIDRITFGWMASDDLCCFQALQMLWCTQKQEHTQTHAHTHTHTHTHIHTNTCTLTHTQTQISQCQKHSCTDTFFHSKKRLCAFYTKGNYQWWKINVFSIASCGCITIDYSPGFHVGIFGGNLLGTKAPFWNGSVWQRGHSLLFGRWLCFSVSLFQVHFKAAPVREMIAAYCATLSRGFLWLYRCNWNMKNCFFFPFDMEQRCQNTSSCWALREVAASTNPVHCCKLDDTTDKHRYFPNYQLTQRWHTPRFTKEQP